MSGDMTYGDGASSDRKRCRLHASSKEYESKEFDADILWATVCTSRDAPRLHAAVSAMDVLCNFGPGSSRLQAWAWLHELSSLYRLRFVHIPEQINTSPDRHQLQAKFLMTVSTRSNKSRSEEVLRILFLESERQLTASPAAYVSSIEQCAGHSCCRARPEPCILSHRRPGLELACACLSFPFWQWWFLAELGRHGLRLSVPQNCCWTTSHNVAVQLSRLPLPSEEN